MQFKMFCLAGTIVKEVSWFVISAYQIFNYACG